MKKQCLSLDLGQAGEFKKGKDESRPVLSVLLSVCEKEEWLCLLTSLSLPTRETAGERNKENSSHM